MSAKRCFFVIYTITLFFLVGCHAPKHRYQGYIEGETLYLSAPFSGILKIMHVQRGEYVKRGQLLFNIDPEPQIFGLRYAEESLKQGEQTLLDLQKPKRLPEIEAIEAQIAQAEAQLLLAQIRVKRNQTLFDKHVLDKDTLDAAVGHLKEMQGLKDQFVSTLALAKLGARPNQINAQQATNNALMASMQQAKWNLKQKKVYAPEAGFIFDTYYKAGEFVGIEHPIASLLTQANTRVEFFVPLVDLKDVVLGKKITYLYPGLKQPLTAVVTYISPKAEYIPPLVYSRDNADKIVFRVKAAISEDVHVISGAPVTVFVEPSHA